MLNSLVGELLLERFLLPKAIESMDRSSWGLTFMIYMRICISFRSDAAKHLLQNVTAREHFVFTDNDGLLYHFIVEGNVIKDGSKIPPDVSFCFALFCYIGSSTLIHVIYI